MSKELPKVGELIEVPVYFEDFDMELWQGCKVLNMTDREIIVQFNCIFPENGQIVTADYLNTPIFDKWRYPSEVHKNE